MRQNKFELSKLLGNGLLASNPKGVNQEGFLELVNIRPWNGKLRYVDSFEKLSVSVKTQMFKIGDKVFACSRDACYELFDGILVLRLNLTASANHWSYANFIKFGILSNGVDKVYIDNGVATLTKPFTATLPSHTALTHVGGQLILCGLGSDYNSLDNTFVAWSKIGKVDFTVDKTHEAGFHNPDIGVVRSVLRCGKGFAALGDKGVALYLPHEQTFSYRKLLDVGIKNQASCASTGDDGSVYFINCFDELTVIHGPPTQALTAGKAPEILDYHWILEGLDTSLFFCEATNELWIQNLNGNFVLNKSGMYRRSLEVSGLVQVGNKLYGTVKSGGTETDAWLRTSKFDFNIAGLKTITEIYAQDSASGTKFSQVTVTKNQTDYQSKEFLSNDVGVSYPHITGNVMSIKHINNGFSEGQISNLHLQTVRVDGRSGLGWAGAQNAN